MIRVTAFHYTANSILIKRVGKSKRGLICRRRAKEGVSAEKVLDVEHGLVIFDLCSTTS